MRQHFIPILHLKHFIGPNPKGQVWTYNAHTGEAYPATPENTAVQTHFYSAENPDGTMDKRIEEYLSKNEGSAAPVYEALLSGEIPKDSQARADFSMFLALMYVRTPAMRQMSAEICGRLIQIVNYVYAINEKAFDALTRRYEKKQGLTLDAETRNLVREAMINPTDYVFEIPKEHTFEVLRVANELAPILYNMKWSLVFPVHGFFITCDNPIVRNVDPRTRHPVYGDHGFFNKTAEVIFPLSPKFLLLMSWNENAPELGAFKRNHANLINRSLAANSYRYLYAHVRHKRLIQLAAEFRDIRPEMTTKGFGPDKFAEIKVPRRLQKSS
jgi:hypothetical protein